MTKIRTYSELITLHDYLDRFRYLKLDGSLGDRTFGGNRYLNQRFYRSSEWKSIRDQVILRDNGMDLGVDGYDIPGKIIIHHMNPIMLQDLLSGNDDVMNPEYLISVSLKTHNAIHYGSEDLLPKDPVDRRPGDTTLW